MNEASVTEQPSAPTETHESTEPTNETTPKSYPAICNKQGLMITRAESVRLWRSYLHKCSPQLSRAEMREEAERSADSSPLFCVLEYGRGRNQEGMPDSDIDDVIRWLTKKLQSFRASDARKRRAQEKGNGNNGREGRSDGNAANAAPTYEEWVRMWNDYFSILPPVPGEQLSVAEVQKVAEEYAHNFSPPLPAYACTDLGNAQMFLDAYGTEVRFCTESQKWWRWGKSRFMENRTIGVRILASKTLDRRREETERVVTAEQSSGAISANTHLARGWTEEVFVSMRIDAMLSLASQDPRITITTYQLDADPRLLNYPNGTLNLQSGVFKDPDRGDLVTKVTDAPYDPNAECPRFRQFVDDLCDSDAQRIEYLQRCLGSALTGDPDGPSVFVLYGSGAKETVTLLQTVGLVLGKYAQRLDIDPVLSNAGLSGIDLASLQGVRFLSVGKSGDSRVDTSTLNQLIRGDGRSTLAPYETILSAAPRSTLFLAVEGQPRCADWDEITKHCVELVPCPGSVPVKDRHRSLHLILHAVEAEGILGWLVEGYKRWQCDGLETLPNRKDSQAQMVVFA